MISYLGFRIYDLRKTLAARRWSLGVRTQATLHSANHKSYVNHHKSSAMTLIELLVVIVILTTLVAGVLPLISPNNEGRKIQEASRGLQTYLMMAQAEAARLGRPVGVGFIESAPNSGVALEAFQLQVPPPYPGQTTSSRVFVMQAVNTSGEPYVYGDTSLNPLGNDGTIFADQYTGYSVYLVQFVSKPVVAGDLVTANQERFPPNMLRIGDVLNVEGNEFLIVDHPPDQNMPRQASASRYLPDNDYVYCVWTNSSGQAWPFTKVDAESMIQDPGANRTFLAMRQPASSERVGVSSTSPYQFPTGTALDLQASGIEGLEQPQTVLHSSATATSMLHQIGIMFSPTGGIDTVWVDGNRLEDVSRVFLLLGNVENGNPDTANYDFSGRQGTTSDISDQELAERRKAVNWLNLNSRWMMIQANSGKYNVVENAGFDPRTIDYSYVSGLTAEERPQANKILQIEKAHELAHHHGD